MKTLLQFNEICKLECIEMSIWPLLYIKEEWCESNIKRQVFTFLFIFSSLYAYYLQTSGKLSTPLWSCIFSQDSRLSAKHMFRCKIQRKIMDFGNNFVLLHFQFDRWLYNTVSGLQFKLKSLMFYNYSLKDSLRFAVQI